MTQTAAQIVAYNLKRARKLRGWTQGKAAEELCPHIGALWSKATWSQAERTVDGKYMRAFTADEILAFARLFDVPVGWFFFPLPESDEALLRLSRGDGVPVHILGEAWPRHT